jgi:predicted nucleotidyltransferase component of viral defense system
MLSYKTIEPHTLELLKKLSQEPFLAKTRLVGGTALALQYGHRMSIDLDFFGEIEEDNTTIREILRKIGPISVYKETTNIKIYSINGIKIDFVNYKYPWIDTVIEKDGLRLASPKDIAAMKINAVEGRGTKKDFIDMYFLLQHYTLEDILKFYAEKYPENSIFRGLMSLTYFEDAENELMPIMFSNIKWNDMKQFILDKVSAIHNRAPLK